VHTMMRKSDDDEERGKRMKSTSPVVNSSASAGVEKSRSKSSSGLHNKHMDALGCSR